MQTLNRGAEVFSEDQLLSHFPCLCLTPVPSYPHLHGRHHVSMALCHPITLLCPEAPASPRHQQHLGQGLVSTLPGGRAPLLCSRFQPRSLFGGSETRHAAWLCKVIILQPASPPHCMMTSITPGLDRLFLSLEPLFPFWCVLGFKPGTYS